MTKEEILKELKLIYESHSYCETGECTVIDDLKRLIERLEYGE